jgi:hypothetical protein
MKAFKTGLGLLAATIAIFALPAAAQAEYLIPPGNSAATQYTEAVPTAGGPKATDPSHHGKSRSPNKVLGSHNAKKLNAQGPEGRAAAEVAAETAPGTVAPAGDGSAPQTSDHPGSQPEANGADNSSAGNGQASAARSGNGSDRQTTTNTTATLASRQIPEGSSGLGEVLGQATGSSDSGQLGLFLPLIVLAAVAWSVAYVLRRRRQPTQ